MSRDTGETLGHPAVANEFATNCLRVNMEPPSPNYPNVNANACTPGSRNSISNVLSSTGPF